jgi:hypothetical protein
LLPDCPGGYCKSFNEELLIEKRFGLHNSVEKVQIVVPMDMEELPAVLTEGGPEEQVIGCFLTVLITKDTRVTIIVYFVISSSE